MEPLYLEIIEYLKTYINDLTLINSLTVDTVKPYIHNYGTYVDKLIPNSVPLHFYKYINIPHIIHDMYTNGDILIFCFDPNEDNETLYSESETNESEHTKGFINGVKLLDDFDTREQITANEYSGGYWNAEIHWVVELKKLT